MIIPCKKSKDNRNNHKQLLMRYSRLISFTSNNVRHRLKVLKLAEETGNVSESCRLSGIDRTSFYTYKRRFRKYGLDGLKDLPTVHHSHPQTTPVTVVKKIISLSCNHPQWGCVIISKALSSKNIHISSKTVQKIITKNGRRTVYDRLNNQSTAGSKNCK